MSARDRMADGYQPDFDLDSEFGKQGELFVADIVDALTNGTAEVKHDAMAMTTGNVYIEYECLRRGRYEPSGIATTRALVWVFVLGAVALCAPTDSVREVARRFYHLDKGTNRYRKNCGRGSHPTRGVAIPVADFIHAIHNAGESVLRPVAGTFT